MSIQSEISRIQSNVQDTINVIQSTGVTVPSGANSDNLPGLATALANTKQDKLTGTQGQVVGFDENGNAVAQVRDTTDAEEVSFTPGDTGMSATNVQDAVTELFTSVSDGKTLVAAAITDKGVATAATDTFAQMAENIGQIVGFPTETVIVNNNSGKTVNYIRFDDDKNIYPDRDSIGVALNVVKGTCVVVMAPAGGIGCSGQITMLDAPTEQGYPMFLVEGNGELTGSGGVQP